MSLAQSLLEDCINPEFPLGLQEPVSLPPAPDPSSGLPSVDRRLQYRLITNYFAASQQHFPLFPTFSRATIEHLLSTDPDNPILHAICVVSAHLARARGLSIEGLSGSVEVFAAHAKSKFAAESFTTNVNLNVIKVALLIAIYDSFCEPHTTRPTSVEEAIRLAYQYGLHRVDSSPNFAFKDDDRDECRCLWWSICGLDGFAGWAYSRAALVNAGEEPQSVLPSVLSTAFPLRHGSKFPSSLAGTCRDAISIRGIRGHGKHGYVLSLAFFRSTFLALQSLNVTDQDVSLQVLSLEDCLTSVRLAVLEEIRDSTQHPPRAALSVHMANGILATKLSQHDNADVVSQWDKCFAAASSILDIVRDLPVNVLLTLNPQSFGPIWFSGVCVRLHLQITQSQVKRQYLLSRINLVYAVLGRVSEVWEIGKSFYGN
ncbi:hypothetical protein BJX64DRAFT_286113 [Aspergillus heterothallicus]